MRGGGPSAPAHAPAPAAASDSPSGNTTNNTLKVIFVGDKLSGKTSTIGRLKFGTGYHRAHVHSVAHNKREYIVKFISDNKKR